MTKCNIDTEFKSIEQDLRNVLPTLAAEWFFEVHEYPTPPGLGGYTVSRWRYVFDLVLRNNGFSGLYYGGVGMSQEEVRVLVSVGGIFDGITMATGVDMSEKIYSIFERYCNIVYGIENQPEKGAQHG